MTTPMKLELVMVPVTDVDRAKEFYERVGFVVDHDQTVERRGPLRAADPARVGLLDRDRPRPDRDGARARSTTCRWWSPTPTRR